MKNLYFLLSTLFFSTLCFGQVQITEIHYDDNGHDDNEGVEIAASVTTNLTGWSINLYDSAGSLYFTYPFPDGYTLTAGQYVGVSFTGGSQPDYAIKNVSGGIVLVNGTTVVDALWYGTSTPAPTTISYTQLTVSEDNNTGNINSMQLTDTGWVADIPATFGVAPSAGLTLSVVKNQIENFSMYPNPVSNGMLYMSSSNNVNKQVAIYAINGQQVYSKNIQFEEKMNISNLNRGIYFVKVEEEGKISTRKLVVN